ncbi:hypothetical protein [Rhizobium croatiense]|uniref:hypothetical protein n=1 Tax=Rhizobium croatiense TaxID=2867516 RepID=UPI0023EB06B8|nr:hypothetical protein [Rhizobium croatiense]WET74986.1 hypothetical protein PYR68_05590 [Rhizobium croatiense]
MFRYFLGAALACLPLVAANAQSANFCRNTFTPNEPIESQFMGLEYALVMHVLAEKYCGVETRPMRPRFLGYIEKGGCNPGTEIYTDVEAAIAKMEAASLRSLAQGENPKLAMSNGEVQEWASAAVKELGGCDVLKRAHGAELGQ